jgi:acyl-CoA synthetase (AMP-forming)/AMP-acid ligase II
VEIENVLRSHPKIYDVGIIGVPDERLDEIAFAVIDPKPGEMLIEEEVARFCGQNLPRCKRPRRIIFDKVPRNPAGKTKNLN